MTRMSRISLQEMSRLSPGTAISSMQVNEAVRCGTLVLWKKNLPENFKTAGELIVSDRGGFIYEPKVGIHDRVAEFDFASLYPEHHGGAQHLPGDAAVRLLPRLQTPVPEIGYRHLREGAGADARGAGADRPAPDRAEEAVQEQGPGTPRCTIHGPRRSNGCW